MGFRRDELEAFRDETVPDLVGPGVRLLFVGINPGLWTAAAGTHFAHPGNRFYPALHAAGITERRIDGSDGMNARDRRHLLDRGIGITNLVRRATVRADELGKDELIAGAQRLQVDVSKWKPRVVAFVGIGAYRTAFSRPKATAGRQPEQLSDAKLYVMGNPSGLNAHETVATLARSFRQAAEAAGCKVDRGTFATQ
jgi:TDG/mug DNA glycosylase family protein